MMNLRTLLQTLAIGSVVCFFQVPAAAQNERELEAAMKQIHELTNHAEALIKAGKLAEASSALGRARELKAKLEAARKKRQGGDDLHGLFNHLEAAVGALQKLGRKDQAEKLAGYARELRQSFRRGNREHGEREHSERRERGRERERERGERRERDRKREGERGERRERDRKREGDRGERRERDRKREGDRGERRKRGRERERDSDRRREGRGRGDRAQLQREIKIFGYAKAAYAELKREKLLRLVELSMHSRELLLEGRRDEKSRKIMKSQPKWGQEVELLNYASKALKEFKASEKAQATAQLARQIQARNKKDKNRDKEHARKENKEHAKKKNQKNRQLTEREAAKQQVETALFCAKVLAKAKRGDAAHSLEHWANALKLRLAGVRNEKAQAVFRNVPSREATAKHLAMAAEILQDQGDKEHAQFVAKMARSFSRRGGRKEHEEEDEIEEEVEEEEIVEEVELVEVAVEKIANERRGNAAERRRATVERGILQLQKQLEDLEVAIRELQKARQQLVRKRDK